MKQEIVPDLRSVRLTARDEKQFVSAFFEETQYDDSIDLAVINVGLLGGDFECTCGLGLNDEKCENFQKRVRIQENIAARVKSRLGLTPAKLRRAFREAVEEAVDDVHHS